MVTTVNKYDVICFQLRNNLYAQLKTPLKKELDQLSSDIKLLFTTGKTIKRQGTQMLSQIFNLRIKAIKWLANDANFDYLEMLQDVVPQIEKLNENKKYEVLTENLLFAVRCNQRVVDAIIGTNDPSASIISNSATKLPGLSYEQFLASLAYAIPDDVTAQKIIDWTNASLHIEFVTLAADIIGDNQLKVSAKTINELSFLVADTAQEYIALATELGVLKSRSAKQIFSSLTFDSSFIKEQKQLADLGYDEFAVKVLDK